MSERDVGERPGRFVVDQTRIEQFLAFGFVPDPHDDEPLALLRQWSKEPRRSAWEVTERALVREGARAMQAAVEQAAVGPGGTGSTGSGDQVVFLSGGLDSRMILAALLENFDRSQIVAATFGQPGERDFDYAVVVAAAAGVRHERLESSSVQWSTEGLVDSVLARQVPLPFPFGQRYLSYLLHARIGRDHVFWDGLGGDAVGGLRSPKEGEIWEWDDAVAEFEGFHLRRGWGRLVSPEFDVRSAMPAAPFCSDQLLAYPDQLVFGVRERSYSATRLLRGYDVRTPFLARPWVDFMLGVPERYRNDQYLYREIQKYAYPRLFSLPSTADDDVSALAPRFTRVSRFLGRRAVSRAARMGLPARRASTPASGANASIRAGFQAPGPTQDLVRQNLTDLAARGIIDWTDLAPFLPGRTVAHEEPRESDVIGLLALELNLKALDRLAAADDSDPHPSATDLDPELV
ncbi:MAG: asparagine synthase-related protein [Cellulomonas sp.]